MSDWVWMHREEIANEVARQLAWQLEQGVLSRLAYIEHHVRVLDRNIHHLGDLVSATDDALAAPVPDASGTFS